MVACAPLAASPLSDDRGRPVPDTPAQRIVTLAPHLAELVHAAGAGDRLAGTVAYSDYPPSVESLPRVGDAFRVDLERLAAVAPDLVLAWWGGNPASAVDEVERLGIPLVAFHAGRLHDIGRHLRLIGALAGSVTQADAAAAAYERRLDTLRARYRGAAPVRVFYLVSERPLYTFGGPHAVNDAIELCGGVNVFRGVDVLAPAVTVEAVLAGAPEVIFSGVYVAEGDDARDLDAWRRWPRIPAVRDGHLYRLDATLMGRPTPRMLDEVERMCEYIARAR